ncbi:MAG: type II secretion system protein GspK [Planctomycetota bacterium]
MSSTHSPVCRPAESGMALLMVLILSILLYAMVTELVTTSQTAQIVGENQLVLARMRNQADYVLPQVEDLLLQDLQAAAAQSSSGGAGAPAGLPGAAGGQPGAAGGDQPEEEDPSAVADGSQDAWFEPTGYPDDDITTYAWAEPENNKFNVLSLVSADQKFADLSRDRFVRLLDDLRDGTDDDITRSDAERIATAVIDWMHSRTRSENLPRMPLKSDDEAHRDVTLMLQLDEMLLLPAVTEDMFFDKVLDSKVIPGLESVLTVYTALTYDSGDPEDNARKAASGGANNANGSGSGNTGNGANAANGANPGNASGSNGTPPQLQGEGIRINVNTAPRVVLRCLFDPSEIPDAVIDGIIRYRNEEVEEDPSKPSTSSVPEDYLGDVRTGAGVKRKMFKAVDEIEEQVPELKNLPDPDLKSRFLDMLTTKSDVFTVHLAMMHKRNEETRTYVLQRERSVLVRIDDGESGKIYPIILHEQRDGLRVVQPDIPEDDLMNASARIADMDTFSQEERAWNPFYIDFYRPRAERDQMFSYNQFRR